MREIRKKELLRKIMFCAVFVLIFFCIRSSVFASYVVPTASMNPTILEGDFFYANKLAYRLKVPFTKRSIVGWSIPERGDIIVFKFPKRERSLFTKRVIGIPGDVIEIQKGQLYINGREIHQRIVESKGEIKIFEENLFGNTYSVQHISSRHRMEKLKVTVPAGHIFVMGDNRENSFDSRYWGMVPLGNVEGKLVACWFSFDTRALRPRFDRVRIMHTSGLALQEQV